MLERNVRFLHYMTNPPEDCLLDTLTDGLLLA